MLQAYFALDWGRIRQVEGWRGERPLFFKSTGFLWPVSSRGLCTHAVGCWTGAPSCTIPGSRWLPRSFLTPHFIPHLSSFLPTSIAHSWGAKIWGAGDIARDLTRRVTEQRDFQASEAEPLIHLAMTFSEMRLTVHLKEGGDQLFSI